MLAPSASDLLKGAVAGLIGGLTATWVMTRYQETYPPSTFQKLLGEEAEEDDGESDDSVPTTVEVAEAISETILDRDIPEEHKPAAGQAVHYSFGTSTGLAYGIASEVFPEVTSGMGLPFGAGFWLAADEVGVAAAGLAEPPWEHPPSVHLYGFSAHLVYGLTLEVVRRTVRSLL